VWGIGEDMMGDLVVWVERKGAEGSGRERKGAEGCVREGCPSAVALGLAGEERPWTGRPLPNARRFFGVRVCGQAADFFAGKARWCPMLASLEDSGVESEVAAGGAGRAVGLPALTS
jgi:hypothetical protein